MKVVYLLLIVVLGSCNAQSNELSQSEFYQIKFNNVIMKDIYESNGDFNTLKTLFGNSLIHKTNTSAPFLANDFFNESIYLSFEDESDTGNDYSITNIKVESSSMGVTIKDKTIFIGDHLNKFGHVKTNTTKGNYSVVFTDQLTGSTALDFKLDKNTQKVIGIEFTAY